MARKQRRTAAASKGRTSFSAVLRAAVQQALADGWTLRGIARESGVPHPTLSTFLAGKALTLPNVDKLTDWLNLIVGPAVIPRPETRRQTGDAF